jgi:hypothetical protein
MRTIHWSRLSSLGVTAVLLGTLVAPMTAMAEDPMLAMAPSAPSWDEASGYGSVEAIRAAIGLGGSDGPVVQVVPPAREIGGLQEEYLAARTVASTTWDETSGYHSVEISRGTASQLLTSPDR